MVVGGATRAVELTSDDHRLPAPGATFDGRDVFGPAAAHLCAGVDLGELGPEVDGDTLVPGVLPVLREDDGVMTAEVLWVDRFGNAAGEEDADQHGRGDRSAVLLRSSRASHGTHPPEASVKQAQWEFRASRGAASGNSQSPLVREVGANAGQALRAGPLRA